MIYIHWNVETPLQFSKLLAGIAEPDYPDPYKFLQYQREQWNRALKADAIDYRWDRFLQSIESAEAALKVGEPDQIAMAFCTLGESIHTLQTLSFDEIGDFYRLKIAKSNQQQSNSQKQTFMGGARDVARRMWADDHERKIRLSEMCDRVYKFMQPLEQELGRDDLLPGLPDVLKRWLRPVAPDYAKKGGRPKK